MSRTTVFWRTFLAQVALIAMGLVVWMQTFMALEVEPQALQSARQIASLVNLTRAALQHADPIARISLVKTLADEERLRIAPRERTDSFVGYGATAFERRLTAALIDRLGDGTLVASEVNGFQGLWVAFVMGQDSYWLLIDPRRAEGVQGRTWLLWMAAAVGLSVLGAAWVARMVSRPLKVLSQATRQVARGDLDDIRLPAVEGALELRDVNEGFAHMVRQLQALESDRKLMLAGISHDVRTPLARLRLEVEMSVPDDQARKDMVADMGQIESILRQFMDYARPGASTEAQMLNLETLWDQWQTTWPGGLPLQVTWGPAPVGLSAWGHATDLSRVFQNLLENAAKYAQPAPEKGPQNATVEVGWSVGAQTMNLVVRDHGPGVPADILGKLTRPFFRADAARSQAAGAGLGLAVASKLVQRMGASLELTSQPGHGLQAVVRLRRTPPPAAPPPAPPC